MEEQVEDSEMEQHSLLILIQARFSKCSFHKEEEDLIWEMMTSSLVSHKWEEEVLVEVVDKELVEEVVLVDLVDFLLVLLQLLEGQVVLEEVVLKHSGLILHSNEQIHLSENSLCLLILIITNYINLFCNSKCCQLHKTLLIKLSNKNFTKQR